MENKIVVSSYRAYSSREQARFIRQEANALLEKANEFSTTSRRVNRRSAYKVLARSLQKTRGLPFSIRKHQALTELSNYISLAKYNKIVGLEAFNTDLLPTSHPRSTRMNSMTASALANSQMRWILDDPRIKDETVKSLLASAMFSAIDSPEHKYSMTRLENMPQGQVPVEVLIAAANPFAGKNSAAARRAREAVQLSDRFERWINMGASLGKRATDGFRVYVKRNDGSTKSLSGELLNQNMFDPNLVDIEVGKGKVATVPTKLGEGLEAFIKSKDTADGYSPVEARLPNGAQALPERSVVISDAPSIYRKDEETKNGAIRYTDDKYDIVKFNNPKEAQAAIGEGQKRAAELDKPEPKLLKKGEVDSESGKQFWNPDEPVLAVYRRGKNTPLAFAQSWKDVNNEILRDEPNLDEDEGRTYTRPEPQTADDNVPLLDQADDILKPEKKKSEKKKNQVRSFPYEVPERAYELNPNEEYVPEFEFDDPVTIANDQTPEDLEDALLTAVEPVSDNEKATGYAPISFTDGREQDVPAEALAAAIREQGGDAEMALAQAYDKIAGNNNNQEALDKSRGAKDEKQLEEESKKADKILKDAEKESKKIKKPTSDEIIEEEIQKPKPKATTSKPTGDVTDGLEDLEDVSEDTYVPPLLKGLSEAELEKFKEDGDYRPYLPKNADIDTPEGLYKLDPNPVDPKENFTPKDLQGEAPDTTALDLSSNTVKDLTSELSNAINGTGEHGSGFGEMLTEDPNGEYVNSPIPAEAIRDALQLKGKDTDAIIEKINKKAGKAKAKIKPPVSEEPEAEEEKTEEEPKPKKGVNYKRVGNRTLLRAGKGGAFKDKEIADFLDENGFEWTGTIERNGETLKVNSESALQTNEEFKAFARELRDRFDIDIQPRAATEKSPAQEPIDIDEPALLPEPPADSEKVEETPAGPEPAPILEPVDEPEPLIPEPVPETERVPETPAGPDPGPELTPKPEVTPQVVPDKIAALPAGSRATSKDLNGRANIWLKQEDGSWVNIKTGEIVDELPIPRQQFGGEWWNDYVFTAPENMGGEDLADDDDSDLVDEVIIDSVINEDKPKPTVDDIVEEVQKRRKLTRAERKALKKEKNHRQQMLIKIIDSNFGPGSFDLKFRERAAVRAMLYELDDLSTEELEDISRVVNQELGWKFIKNLPDKAPEPDQTIIEPEEKPEDTDTAPDDADIIDAEIIPSEEEVAEEERARKLKEIRDRKKREREDKLIAEDEKEREGDLDPVEDDSKPKPDSSETPPPPLSPAVKETIRALVDRRRKIQRKIDKADLDEGTTAAKRKDLKDELDEVTRIIDSLVLGEKPEETPTTPTTPTTAETPTAPEEPASSAQLLKGVTTNNLKPNDVLVNDHFTITDIKREGTKRVNVGGVSQDIPAYRVSGYFPSSVEQSSKLWSEDYAPDIYRGATPPVKGDSPELNQPKAEDYGSEYAFPNQTKVKFKERTLYAPKNKELADKFLEDYAVYDAERLRRKALWEAPEISKENNNDSPVTPTNSIYIENVLASDVKVGDIAFRKDKFGAREFFTVTKVLGTKDGVTSLEGHYVGHQTQTKEWRSGTTIDVIRGEKNLPAAGDKEPLDRPDKSLPNASELEKARKAKIAEADKGYSPDFPTDKAAQGITALATKPTLPAFYGSSEELIALGDGAAILSSLDSSDKGFIVFDFETIGKDVQNSANPDAPIQVAAVKYVGGEKVDELNIYINPGEPLGNYYYETDEAGNKTLKANRMRDAEGNPITDEWLATQPSVKEQLQKLVDFFGPNAVLVGQNNTFDINLLERWAEKLGINFKLDGAIDTLAIAKALQKIEEKSLTFPKSPSDGDEILSSEGNAWVFSKDRNKWVAPSNSLSVLAKRLGVSSGSGEDFHNALFDVEVTEKVLRALLGKLKAGDIPAGGSKKYDEKFKTWIESRDQRARDISEIEAAKLLSGKTSNLDDAIASVDSVSDEKVVIAEGEEEITPVKSYVSGLYKDTINEEWVRDPENTDFIPNARVKDIKPGDFIFGEAGDILEVIKLEDDEVLPADFVKVVRANMSTGLIFSERQTPREDGGTGWFLKKNLEGGIYRRKENAEKTRPQIETEIVEAIEVSDPVVIPVVEPVKSEEVTSEQAAVVVDNAIDAITTSKPDSSIEEAVKGLNVDETIKDQVVAEAEAAPAATVEASSSVHLSADGEPIEYRDRVIHGKNLRTGVITSLMPLFAKKYKNYVKVKFDDNGERENVAASALRITEKSTIGEVRKPLVDSDSLAEVTAKIKDIQGTTPADGALNPEELAQKFKEAEVIRDKEVEKTNFVKTSSAIVKKITENLPIKSTTKSSLPSLKTGEPYDVTFAFDKPNVKELKDLSKELNLDSEDDLIVFRASKDKFLRNQPVATIKTDGSIIWQKENDKRVFSLELEKALENLESPVTNISAMTVMAEPDDNQGTDYENDGNGTLLGELESTFDYNNISKFPPTDEQRVIIDAIMSGKNVVVQALAGTGKTSTLVLTAERLKLEKPDNKILYNVFNKETAEEAQGRMPDNVDSRTSDGLAYAQMKGHQKRNQLSGATDLKGRSLLEYADYINLFEYYEFEPVTVMIRGAELTLGRNELVPTLREAVSKFAISADDTLTEKHFAKKESYYDTVPQVLVDYANRIWDDAREVDGWKPNSPKLAKISFDTIFKAWAINNPQFSDGLMPGATSSETEYKAQKLRFNQMFMFDEAQDINPVTAKLLKDQENIQKVYVGDSNQAIYAFRGAVDELNNITDAVELYLTQTFRFGPTIAAIPNRFLTLLGSKKKIIGKPGEDDGVVFEAPGTMEDPTMIIGRTNGALLAEVFEMLAAGKKPGLNLETYFKLVSYAKSAKWLMEANTAVPSGTKPKLHPDLAGFQNWNEVLKAVQEGRNVGGATYFVRLLRDRGMFPSQILQTLGQITPIRGTGFREDKYVPLEKEVLKEGSKGDLGNGRSAQGFKIKTKYEVKDGILELRNVQSFQDFFLKRDDIKDLITYKQITEFNPKAKKDVTYSIPTLAITPETEEKVLDLVNDIRRWLNNYSPRIPIDTELITAHKSKGKESDRVKILNDFAQPELDDEGVMQLPDPEELRLSYVATSRAKKALDIGESLAWIRDFTTDEDGIPELTEVENIIGMSVAADPEPVTPEEAGKEVVKARKITDQKTLEVAERLIALIEKGVVPWTKGWTAGGVPMNGVSKKAYRGTNTMVLWAAIAENGWKDPRFFTFNQGKELGGSVRKGEKGTTILKPNIVSKEVKQKDGSLKKQTYMYFTNVSVFNAEQFDNLKLPALIKKEPVPITDIETQILESYKDHPEIINKMQDSAYYLPTEDKIYLPLREQFKDVKSFIETLFHELAHSTGHISRLGKDGKRKDLQDNYGKHREARGEEELIAEISVALIAAEFGVEIDWGNVAAYADSWLTPLKNDPGMIIIAAKQAQDAVNRILGVDSTKTDDEIKSAFPGLQDYKDGGSGGLVGSRSTVGFVSTDALKDMAGNVAGNEEAVGSYRKSLREGKGFAIKDFNGRPFNDPIMVIYDNETGLAYVGEGNHRLQAAIAENIPYVPVRVVNGRASEMVEDAEKGRFPKQIKNDKEPEFLETGSLSGQPVSEGYVPPEMHPSYVFDKEFISDVVPNFVDQSDPFAPPAVGEGVGSEGLTGDQIAEDGGLKPEPTPEPNVGEQGRTGEEIAAETGVASIKGEYQKGTSNSGALKDGMNYEIQMRERNLISGQTSGDLYGVRKIVVSGNTFKNKEELKSAGFTYDGDTKTWSKSYFEKVFPVDTLTQDVLDRNPDPEIDKDLSKFLDKPAAQSPEVGELPAASSKTPKNKDTSVEPTKFTFEDKEYDLWNDITYDRESDRGADNQSLESAHGIFAKRILDGQDLVTDRDEISDYISEILNKYGYGNKFFIVASGDVSNKMLGKDPIKGSGQGIEAGIGRSNQSLIPEGHPLKNIEFPVFLIRKRGASKIALLHEIAHLMEAGWKTGLGGGHNQIWHQTFLALLRQEGFQKEANLLSLTIGEVKGDTGAISP